MDWFKDRNKKSSQEDEKKRTPEEEMKFSEEASNRIKQRALEMAKTMSPNELTELFLAADSAMMLQCHCAECMMMKSAMLGSYVVAAPFKAIEKEKNEQGIPTIEDPFAKPGEVKDDGEPV